VVREKTEWDVEKKAELEAKKVDQLGDPEFLFSKMIFPQFFLRAMFTVLVEQVFSPSFIFMSIISSFSHLPMLSI